jgi:hypothetical protein
MFNLLINQLITELSDIEKGLGKAQEKKKVIIGTFCWYITGIGL